MANTPHRIIEMVDGRPRTRLVSAEGANMKIAEHPLLKGVLCREDGAVLVPFGGKGYGPHWTFGCRYPNGYRYVGIRRHHYAVHRLMAETFLQCPIPDGMQIDHIDRCPSNNKLTNIRIVTPSENQRNRAVCLETMRDVVSQTVDPAAYQRARYANNPESRERLKARQRARYANDPEYRERLKARRHARYANDPERRERKRESNHDYYAKKKAQGLVYRKGPDGKQRWFPKDSSN